MILLALLAALSLPAYRERLQRIDAQLAQGDSAAAARAAERLLDEDLDGGLAPDAYALQPIAEGHPHRARLQSLIAALGPSGAAAAPPDRDLLEDLRRAQEPLLPAAGGEVKPLPVRQPPFFEQLAEWIEISWKWFIARLDDLFEWLRKLFPDARLRKPDGSPAVVPLVLIGVGLILVLLLVLAVRSFRHAPAVQTARSRSARAQDEDPLSRTASGWEARARELAAQGAFREAIRAWYHALLVHCYGAGVLHYRRGRTNWEYAHALSPQLAWRPRFEELTRAFDVEWYGRPASTAAALDDFAAGTGEILQALGRRA